MPPDARQRFAVAAALCLLAAPGAHAQDGVAIEAHNLSYSRDGSVLDATGGVRAAWDGSTLVADSVHYESDADVLKAVGGVVLDTPDVLLDASSCTLSVEQETAELRDVDIEVKDGHTLFGGATVRKLPGLRFELEDAYFTTCDKQEGREPDWSITGRRANIEVDGYAKITGASFRIRGVPVLHSPVLVLPAILNRHSGFLLPKIGTSSKRGFIYSQPYFWAIDKHQDLTTTAGVETSARLGLGLDYRYRPSRTTAGEAQLYYYNEAIRTESKSDVNSPLFDDDNIPENRVIVDAHHRQRPMPDLKFYSDVLFVSDDVVLRETDDIKADSWGREELRTILYTDSRVGLMAAQKSPKYGFVSSGVSAAYYQNLTTPNRYTLQDPGRVWVRADGDAPYGLGWNLDSQLGSFYRTDGVDGQRVDVNTTVERGLIRGGGPVRATTWARGRLTGYRNEDRALLDVSPPPPDDPSTANVDESDQVGEFIKSLDRWAARGVGEAGMDLWTGFMRTYALGGGTSAKNDVAPAAPRATPASAGEPGIWGEGDVRERFSALHHTIEPFSALRFTRSSDQSDLPLYDGVDRIHDRTTFTYGTASRFLFTEAGSGRRSELARLSVAQTYDLEDRVVDDHFSDIDTALSLRPTRAVSFSGLASYNVGTSSLRGAAATLALERFRLPFLHTDRSELAAAYRFVRRGAVETAEEGLQTLQGRTLLALTDNLAVGANGRYDFVSRELVESGGGFRIQSSCRCWTIDIGVLKQSNPDETLFRLQVDLGGIGGLGASALGRGSTGLSSSASAVAPAGRYGW